MTVVGEVALWVALFLSVWGSVASIAGARPRRPELLASGRRAVTATAVMLALASLGLWGALFGHDFTLRYVASHTTLNTPALYLLTAFWAGPAGRTLFFAFAIAITGAAGMAVGRRLEPPLRAAAVGALATVLALVLVVACFGTNPYDSVEWVPAEGQGLDPQLQTPLAAVYFLATYTGYGAATVALALGVGAALVGRLDRECLAAIRNWGLACWCLLSVAIAIRMRWDYLRPESSGFETADPAQLTTIVIWALIFSLVLVLRRRGDTSQRTTGSSALRPASMIVFGVGLAMIAGAVAASSLWADHSVRLRPGESAELTDRFGGRWRFVSQGASRDEQTNHLSTSVALEVWQDQERVGFVSAERRQYLDSMQRPTSEPTLKPGIESSPLLDVYVLLSGLRRDSADLRISFRPFVGAVWTGWLLLAAGGVALALAPTRRTASATRAASDVAG